MFNIESPVSPPADVTPDSPSPFEQYEDRCLVEAPRISVSHRMKKVPMAPETEPVAVPSATGQELTPVLPADIRKEPHPTLVRREYRSSGLSLSFCAYPCTICEKCSTGHCFVTRMSGLTSQEALPRFDTESRIVQGLHCLA